MSEHVGYLTVTATAEVRDADGNLISTNPVETQIPVTQADLDRLQGEQQ